VLVRVSQKSQLFCCVRHSLISAIISAERGILLDIDLPQSSPRRSVLCCPHPAACRDLHQIVGPLCGGPTNSASRGTRSPFEDLSAPTTVSPPRNVPCPLPLEVCNSSFMSVTLVHLRISSFLIRSRRETPSIALSVALCMTLSLLIRPIVSGHVSVP
jgi:hypothetical protein